MSITRVKDHVTGHTALGHTESVVVQTNEHGEVEIRVGTLTGSFTVLRLLDGDATKIGRALIDADKS